MKMRKILTVIMLVLLLFTMTACVTETVESEREKDNFSMFVVVESASSWRVVYHRQTKVMYVISDGYYNQGTFTLLVNSDGTPMIWE